MTRTKLNHIKGHRKCELIIQEGAKLNLQNMLSKLLCLFNKHIEKSYNFTISGS